MTEKQFEFGVDIPNSWKQKTMKNERRFVDLEGFRDEDYDGEHHMLWDNQKECWIHLDDALCLMEKQYREIKEENEQLKQLLKEVEHELTSLNGLSAFDKCASQLGYVEVFDEDYWELDYSEMLKKIDKLKGDVDD